MYNENIVEINEPTLNKTIQIFAKVDANLTILDLQSSIFQSNDNDGVLIDSGIGDDYAYTGLYIDKILKKPLYDNNMCANFKLETSETSSMVVVERTEEEKLLELDNIPKPVIKPTLDDVVIAVDSLQIDTDALFIATNEVDMKSTFNKEDVDFLANAMFEIDGRLLNIEKLIPSQTRQISQMLDFNNTLMIEMWARWIQTGRRALSQCPGEYIQYVENILKNI